MEPDLHKIKRQCITGFLSQPLFTNKQNCVGLQDNNNHQPVLNHFNNNNMDTDDCNNDDDEFIVHHNSYSQPLNIEDMFLSTQSQMDSNSQSSSNGSQSGTRLYLRVVRRMTRFLTKVNPNKTFHILDQTFTTLEYSFKKFGTTQFSVTINDKKHCPLVFKAIVKETEVGNCAEQALVDFRLCKVCCF